MNQHKWACAIWQGRKDVRKWTWLWNFRNPIPAIIDKVRSNPHISAEQMDAWMDGWIDGHFDECNDAEAKLITATIIAKAKRIERYGI